MLITTHTEALHKCMEYVGVTLFPTNQHNNYKNQSRLFVYVRRKKTAIKYESKGNSFFYENKFCNIVHKYRAVLQVPVCLETIDRRTIS